jgi:hypothetical protein
MTEAEIEVTLKQFGADQLALRMCIVQLITSRMRDQTDIVAARATLRTFDNEVQGFSRQSIPPMERPARTCRCSQSNGLRN